MDTPELHLEECKTLFHRVWSADLPLYGGADKNWPPPALARHDRAEERAYQFIAMLKHMDDAGSIDFTMDVPVRDAITARVIREDINQYLVGQMEAHVMGGHLNHEVPEVQDVIARYKPVPDTPHASEICAIQHALRWLHRECINDKGEYFTYGSPDPDIYDTREALRGLHQHMVDEDRCFKEDHPEGWAKQAPASQMAMDHVNALISWQTPLSEHNAPPEITDAEMFWSTLDLYTVQDELVNRLIQLDHLPRAFAREVENPQYQIEVAGEASPPKYSMTR